MSMMSEQRSTEIAWLARARLGTAKPTYACHAARFLAGTALVGLLSASQMFSDSAWKPFIQVAVYSGQSAMLGAALLRLRSIGRSVRTLVPRYFGNVTLSGCFLVAFLYAGLFIRPFRPFFDQKFPVDADTFPSPLGDIADSCILLLDLLLIASVIAIPLVFLIYRRLLSRAIHHVSQCDL